MVGEINHLANPQNEAVREVLFFIYIIANTEYNEYKPYDTRAKECDVGGIKHNV